MCVIELSQGTHCKTLVFNIIHWAEFKQIISSLPSYLNDSHLKDRRIVTIGWAKVADTKRERCLLFVAQCPTNDWI